ncbi:MAG: TonB-dependent receptor [Candidatus Marinimicrobia bacterium]|nr:TonB-dependent receptor [Candidatus Neomarinimicrobiota bacterium]
MRLLIKYVMAVFLSAITLVLGSPVGTSSGGSLVGHIYDQETGEDIGWTTVLLEEINRSVSAHSDGEYHFFDIPVGKYTLKAFRIGYHDYKSTVEVVENQQIQKDIQLSQKVLFTEEVTVESQRYKKTSDLQQPDIEVSGKKLRENIGLTIAETISSEPGLSQRTMGPAPARPVLRGLSGDRFLMLEDGERPGDLSATSSDHAVAIEPISADRIVIIRGPEAMLYGSNTLGGVINVNRNYIPMMLPHRLTGNFALHSESVNAALASGAKVLFPVGNFALKMDGSRKTASNINTPIGELKNTTIDNNNGSIGVSYFPQKGNIGSAFSFYNSNYGIPPQPDSIGGHPMGVDIRMERQHIETKAEYFPGFDWLHHIELKHSYKRYQHAEFEANGQVGMRFGVLTHDLSMLFHLAEHGVFSRGVFGLWFENRDYATSGLSFTPATVEKSLSLFHYNEHKMGEFAFNFSARYDIKSVEPAVEKIIVRADYSNHIHRKIFQNFSGGLSGIFAIRRTCSLGIQLMRSYRAPGIEELFSEGPHLAAYSYEVGHANLKEETGIGSEVFFNIQRENLKFHLAVFRNQIDNYIFPMNTGRTSLRIASLYLYQYSGEDVVMQGVESSLNWHFTSSFILNYSMGYTEGKIQQNGSYLPQIPPLESNIGLVYEKKALTLGANLKTAMKQDKLGEFENPTGGYAVLDLNVQYYFKMNKFLHTITLTIQNAGDTEYRHHLNRIKEIFPEPGRNVKLLYKVYF